MNQRKSQKQGKRTVKKQTAKKVVLAPQRKQQNKPKQKVGFIGQALRTVGAIAGGTVGQAKLGQSAGAAISRIFGQGDYSIQSNSLMKGGPPAFAAMDSGIRISHREYIADVVSSTSFANTTYDINPSSGTTFPWLSKLVSNFEEYEMKGLVFYFNTTCGNSISSTNNALGTVGLTSVYDPTDPALGSKRECEDYSGCVAGIPACSLLSPVECKAKSNVLSRKFVQISSLSNPEDKKFYSIGTLNVFTQGMQQAGVIIGELWVSYDIELFNPKILPVGTVYQAASKVYSTNIVTNTAHPLGEIDFSFQGNLGATYTGSTGAITLPQGTSAGYYLVSVGAVTPTVIANLTGPSALSANIVAVNVFQSSTQPYVQAPNGSLTSSLHNIMFMVNKLDTAAATFSFAWSAAPGAGGTGIDVVITKMHPSVIPGISSVPFSFMAKSTTINDLYALFKDKLIQELKPLGPAIHHDRAAPVCDCSCCDSQSDSDQVYGQTEFPLAPDVVEEEIVGDVDV